MKKETTDNKEELKWMMQDDVSDKTTTNIVFYKTEMVDKRVCMNTIGGSLV